MSGAISRADATFVIAPMATTYSGVSLSARARAIKSSAAALGTGRSGAASQEADPWKTKPSWERSSFSKTRRISS